MISVLRKLGSLFTVSSKFCAISKWSYFWSAVSNFGTNFAEILLKTRCSLDCDSTILHHQGPYVSNNNLICGCWGPTRTWFTLHWWVAIFKVVVPVLYLCGAHCFVLKHLLSLAYCLNLRIAKFTKKILCNNVIQVFLSFRLKRKSDGSHLHVLTHQRLASEWLVL